MLTDKTLYFPLTFLLVASSIQIICIQQAGLIFFYGFWLFDLCLRTLF